MTSSPAAAPRSPGHLRRRLTWTMRLVGLDLRRHRRARVTSACAFALAMLAACASLGAWRSRREVARVDSAGDAGGALIAFLRDDVPAPARDALALVLGQLPGVAGVRQLASDEALARLRAELGDRGAMLDGVEEGFLPATIEISLRPGADGVGRADAIAWRLRRMEGIADVDVLRTAADERLARAGLRTQRLGLLGVWLGGAAALGALVLAAAALRARRADAHLLCGFGFTAADAAAPAAFVGGLCAVGGAALAVLLLVAWGWVGTGLASDAWWSWASAASTWSDAATSLTSSHSTNWKIWAGTAGALVGVITTGAGVGWWGARVPRRESVDAAFAD
ncbi:MAG: permease-like cell division protein FtsX [Pseudomonadota bacterium]